MPWLILLAIFVATLIFAKRTKHFFSCIIFSGVSGLLCLFALGFLLPNCVFLSTYSVCCAIATGIPGVITTVILNFLLA